MNPVKVITRVVAREDTSEKVREILVGLIEPTRNEEGCVTYELLENRTDQVKEEPPAHWLE